MRGKLFRLRGKLLQLLQRLLRVRRELLFLLQRMFRLLQLFRRLRLWVQRLLWEKLHWGLRHRLLRRVRFRLFRLRGMLWQCHRRLQRLFQRLQKL